MSITNGKSSTTIMPELPEVYTITNDLLKNVLGYTIRGCTITNGYIALPTNDTFKNTVINQKVVDVQRIAKNILIHLSNKSIIHFHLAMTGQILLKENDNFAFKNWLRVLLNIESGGDTKFLAFNDMRMFGKIAVITESQVKALYDKYGPEPIDETIDIKRLWGKLTSKRTTIKNALLDQELVAGLGNIYATDALFLARIHPELNTKTLTLKQTETLLEAARQVLTEGIDHRGSTLADKMYVDIFGKAGFHQDHFKIYSKEFCPNCSTKVEFKKINGRGTYFCPKCQAMEVQVSMF